MTIKLVITELLHTNKQKSIRKVLSPIISSIPSLSPKFGIFHTALIVGPFFLEWTDSSICIPKKIAASMVLLALDVGSFHMSHLQLNDMIDQIAQVVIDWNINKTYCAYKLSGKEPNEGNCQGNFNCFIMFWSDFVDAILNKLNITPSFHGALGNFLSEMRTKGTGEMIFKPDTAFLDKFDLHETNEFVFHTHEELDKFVCMLQSKYALFDVDFAKEKELLKSFDRAFWIRHLHTPSDAKYQPCPNCPFDNPKNTGSVLMQ